MKPFRKLIPVLLFPLLLTSCEEVDQFLADNQLTNEEIVEGLKTALTVATDTSVVKLSATDGYFKDQLVKILLPPEAGVIINNISKIPGGNLLIDNTILAINRSAEDAANEATPIFISAITGMTITDGLSILNGTDTAATAYLRTKTYPDLEAAFLPKIQASLGKKLVGNVSAESAYASLINTYNQASLGGVLFPMVKTNSLSAHTTGKALNGLFIKIAAEETMIRNEVSHRVNDILKKVFKE